MTVAPSNSLYSFPNQDASEAPGTITQDEPTIPENEEPVADFNALQSPNSNGEVPCLPGVSIDKDGLGSTGEDEQANERRKKRIALKLFLFDSTTSLLGTFVSLSAMGFGYGSMDKCPANLYLPYMVFIIGILGLFIVWYAVLKTSIENFGSLEENEGMVIEASSWLLAGLWICEVGQFFYMDVSFDSSAENYCDHWLYVFTIFMNIFLVLGFIIGYVLLYLDPDDFDRTTRKTPRGPHEWMAFDSSDDSD